MLKCILLKLLLLLLHFYFIICIAFLLIKWSSDIVFSAVWYYLNSTIVLTLYWKKTARAGDRILREHLCAHKAVLYLSHFFLYFINFIHKFHMQIINYV